MGVENLISGLMGLGAPGDQYMITDTRQNPKKNLLDLAQFKKFKIHELTENEDFSDQTKVYSIPLSKINIDRKNFQNRETHYSKESVERIINAVKNNTFRFAVFDPILLWRNPETKQFFILSGHSRTEAFKRLANENIKYQGYTFDRIPAKILECSLEEARKIANNSNNLNTAEADFERALYYYKLRKNENLSNSKILALCKETEPRDATRIFNYSFLNPDGRVSEALKTFQSADTQSRTKLQSIASWIGTARRQFPELTDLHESEIFTYLINEGYGNKTGQISNEADFIKKIQTLIIKNTEYGKFKQDEPLNIKRIQDRSPFEVEYIQRLQAAEKEVKEAQKIRDEKRKHFVQNDVSREQFSQLMQKYDDALRIATRNYLDIKDKQSDYIKAGQKQTSLFSGAGLGKILVSFNMEDEDAIRLINQSKNVKDLSLKTGKIQYNVSKLSDNEIQELSTKLTLNGMNHLLGIGQIPANQKYIIEDLRNYNRAKKELSTLDIIRKPHFKLYPLDTVIMPNTAKAVAKTEKTNIITSHKPKFSFIENGKFTDSFVNQFENELNRCELYFEKRVQNMGGNKTISYYIKNPEFQSVIFTLTGNYLRVINGKLNKLIDLTNENQLYQVLDLIYNCLYDSNYTQIDETRLFKIGAFRFLQPALNFSIGATEVLNQNKNFIDTKGFTPTYQTLYNYDNLIDTADLKDKKQGHGLTDTLKLIRKTVQDKHYQVKALAQHLKAETLQQSGFNIWHWLHTNIKYDFDKPGVEQIRTPARAWADRKIGVDCDCLAVFTACILIEMGYKPIFEIVAFNKMPEYQHIYINCNGIIIDRVLNIFNERPKNITKILTMEIPVMALSGISDNSIYGLGAVAPPNAMTATLLGVQTNILNKHKAGKSTGQDARELRKVRTLIMLNGTPEQDQIATVMPYVYDVTLSGNFVFDNEEIAGLAEQYHNEVVDIENLHGLGELGKGAVKKAAQKFTAAAKKVAVKTATATKTAVKTTAKATAKATKTAVKATATAAKKVVKTLIKFNPVTIAARNAFRVLVGLNFMGVATKLSWGKMTQTEAQKAGISSANWQAAQKGYKSALNMYKKAGGQESKLNKSIDSAKTKKPLLKKDIKPGATVPIEPAAADGSELGALGEVMALMSALTAAMPFLTPLFKHFADIKEAKAKENEKAKEAKAKENEKAKEETGTDTDIEVTEVTDLTTNTVSKPENNGFQNEDEQKTAADLINKEVINKNNLPTPTPPDESTPSGGTDAGEATKEQTKNITTSGETSNNNMLLILLAAGAGLFLLSKKK